MAIKVKQKRVDQAMTPGSRMKGQPLCPPELQGNCKARCRI